MAFANHDGRGEAPMAEINIIPLCDVLLVLLIIFMVTAPALSHQIDLTLPQPGPPPEEPLVPRDPVDLRIDAAGQVFWNGQATDRAGLDALMREQGRAAPMQQALLRIDANGDCDYQSVAQVLAMARNAGLAKIGFVQD
ncbi:MAG: biopolymer transporter ExbD [Luteimonas sp.]|nr:biopolymer transporter ExbD [Luteimonas sp.]